MKMMSDEVTISVHVAAPDVAGERAVEVEIDGLEDHLRETDVKLGRKDTLSASYTVNFEWSDYVDPDDVEVTYDA